MNRTGLIVALVIAAVTGVIFALFPEIELRIARPFYEFIDVNHNAFSLRFYQPFAWIRDSTLWLSALLVAPAVAALLIKLIHPRRKMLVSGRAVIFLMSTLVLGPGLLVNVTLKDHWGRPRPIEVTQFEGTEHYVPWWDPRGECDKNCSFVSGDVAGAIWTMAPAALAPPQWRAFAYGGSLALGAVIAALRVMQGGHFVSDTIFAGVFTFLIIWVVYGLIYRWPRTRLSDEAVERGLERFSASIAGLFGKRKSEP
ncbi:MAG TPA: phosphatase PAP2 family protein [Pseudolabrys sp.]|jgi:membrane-associated PAP2 superfamily phosphatase